MKQDTSKSIKNGIVEVKIPQDRSENQEDVHDRSISAKMAATVSKSAQIIPHSPCVYPPQFCTLQVRRA